ncbi:MAG TPA: serine/threonine protein kinase [Candidatus Corynebacterium avicola]|uniref:non-specific serine/threonine protein kinase n=1 Tax=Candidatus Corynebacterium avicola TaxID=2838527 RepID=A0A9D1RM52_9CORY|nr:serine/threonine protein kinase [Candidatus Corynebacterium avicola]
MTGPSDGNNGNVNNGDNVNNGASGNTPDDGTRLFGTPGGTGSNGETSQRDQAAAERIQRVLDAHYGAGDASDGGHGAHAVSGADPGHRFTVSRIVGRGGMSTVWLAYDAERGQDVAVKVLKPELTDDPEFRNRFRLEAEAAETIDSENVVATYDYGEQPNVDGTGVTYCFIVMEYVQGESLADILARQKTLPEVMALDLIAQAAVGLQAIHGRGLIHRDIKPGNLMITADGVVKVTDFGIAKAASAVPLTRTGMVVGTAQYVSPEQAQGLDIEPSSDVYSLGVVGYEVLAGERPFAGDSTVSVALKHINEAAPELPGTVTEPMRRLIAICLRKEADTRYPDGAALAAATVPVREGEMPPDPAAGAIAVPPSLTDPTPTGEGSAQLAQVTDESNMGPAPSTRDRKRKRNGSWIFALVVALLAALALLGWAVYSMNNGDDTPTTPTQTETVTDRVTEEETVEPPPVTVEPTEDTPETTETPTQTTPTETPTETDPGDSDPTDTGTPSEPTDPTDGNGGNGGTGENGDDTGNGELDDLPWPLNIGGGETADPGEAGNTGNTGATTDETSADAEAAGARMGPL